MTLVGTVQEVNNPDYLGSPVRITADLDGGTVTFAFGPLTGGRFAVHTVVATGPARVKLQY